MAKVSPNLRLNKEQQDAIKFGEGPLLIIAGAGTGKTTVITERIKYLIFSKKATPQEILALTFTEKAAREMEERVDVAMPYGYTQMWIMTFHSFCDRILRCDALHIGLDPRYKLMTEAEAVQLLRKNIFKLELNYFRPLGNPTKFLSGMLQHFSRLQDEDVSPSEYSNWVKKQKAATDEEKVEVEKWQELSKAYKAYDEIKVKEGLMDFGDLIVKTLKLFRDRPNILKEYQKKFKYLLVDEFQDTNYAQNELTKLLSGKTGNINVVGDDDQCLPGSAKISTQDGYKLIKDIQIGEYVLSAVGKGHLSLSKVLSVNKNRKRSKFLSFTTESGQNIEVTDNHKMFCMVPGRNLEKGVIYYVYLIQRQDLGWRLGFTSDLAQRLKLESSADKIIAVRSCESLEEARFFESVYSMKYQIPTYPFKPRKSMILTGEWLQRLFSEFDTQKGAEKLSVDLGIDLNAHHYALDAVVRGNKERIKIILKMCSRKYSSKSKGRILISPKILHEVRIESSSDKIKTILFENNIETTKAKKGWRVRRMFSKIEEAGRFARKLQEIANGILEVRFDVGRKNERSRSSLMMPAGNILTGMYIPVIKKNKIVYERVIHRGEQIRTETVHDLEVGNTHNFIADGVVVHNSIYRFRGAAVSNIVQFRKSFPKTKVIVLTKNYRSTQEILDRSHDLIEHNNPDRLEVVEKIDKKLVSQVAKDGEEINFIHSDRVENESDQIARKILRLNVQDKYSWRDFAILVRANNHSEPIMRALGRNGIPFQFLGPGRLFRQPEIVDLISYLKVLYNFEDSVAFYKLISNDSFGIPGRELAAIGNYARKFNKSLFESAENIDDIFVTGGTKEIIKKLLGIINKHLNMVNKETAGQLLYYFLEETGLLQKLLSPKSVDAENKAKNISKFFDKLKTYEVDHEDSMVPAVVDWLDLSMELGESPLAANEDWTDINAVNILTVHSAKGLEFPVVFIVNLVGQRFPTIERREQIPIPESLIKEVLPVGDYHQEEERRLFYVGMTRAKEKLILTAADYYGEGKREKKLSPFIFEALGNKTVSSERPTVKVDQLSFLDYEPKVKSFETLAKDDKPLHINYLSYSQIETFQTCPMHYKLRYIYKVPTPPSASQSFGTVMHTTLKNFFEEILSGTKPSDKLLYDLLEKNWVKEGYKSKSHEKEFFQKGKDYLVGFLKNGFNPKVLPVALEQPFTIPIGRDLKIGGRIDRIDDLGNGEIEIIDYKTGATIPTQRDVDKNLQLSFYALAATKIPIAPFGKTPDNIKLSLYYLDEQEKISTFRTVKQLDDAVTEIIKVRDEIEKSDFKCSGHIFCQTGCEFSLFCKSE